MSPICIKTLVFRLFAATYLVLVCGTSNAQHLEPLVLGVPHAKQLEAGESHRFAISMADNQAAILSLRRGNLGTDQEMNYVMTVLGPSGRVIEEVNTATGASLCYFRSREPGEYLLMVRRWNGIESGSYDIELLVHDELADTIPEQIDQLLEHFYSPDRPGAAVAAVVAGEVVYKRTYGLASVEYQRPVLDNTAFELASCSKQFTGYAIAMLAEQGALSLHDDIREYLASWQHEGPAITIRHLVHHLSGIYDYEPAMELAGYPRDGDDSLSFDRILRAIRLQPGTYFEPGTAHRYSNSGYVLLAEIISSVTGMPFADWIEANILASAQMADAYVRDSYRLVERGKAMSYQLSAPSDAPLGPVDGYHALPNYLQAVGAAHVHASLNDMIKWAIHSRDGSIGGRGAASRFRQGILAEPQDYDYLYGLATSIHRGVKREFHQGLSLGYRTGFYHYPDADATVIYLTNDGEWRTYYLAEKVAEILLAHTLERHIESAADSISPPLARVSTEQKAEQPALESQLDAYTGTFSNDALGSTVRIVQHGGQLEVHSVRHSPIGLRHSNSHAFHSSNWIFGNVEFEVTEGVAESLVLQNTSDGRPIRFRRLPRP